MQLSCFLGAMFQAAYLQLLFVFTHLHINVSAVHPGRRLWVQFQHFSVPCVCVNRVVKCPRQKIKAVIFFYNYIYCWLCTNNGHPDGLDKSDLCFGLARLLNFSQLFKSLMRCHLFSGEMCYHRFPHLSLCWGWLPICEPGCRENFELNSCQMKLEATDLNEWLIFFILT